MPEARHIVSDSVQEAGFLAKRLASLLRTAFTEQPVEDLPRVGLVWKGRGWRGPRQIVLIHAREAVIALADDLENVHPQLERRYRGVLADLPGRDLVDGCPQVVVRTLGQLCLGAAEKRRVRCCVRTRIGVLQLHVGHDRDGIPMWGQRAQDGRELLQIVVSGRSPTLGVGSHRDEDVPEPPDRPGRRCRAGGHGRHHRVQQRQCHCGAHAFQHRSTVKRFLGDDHRDLLIWNGRLCTTPRISDENR